MKKRIISSLLVLCLIATMLPLSALAAGNVVTVKVTGEKVYQQAHEVLAIVNQERAKAGQGGTAAECYPDGACHEAGCRDRHQLQPHPSRRC